MKKVFMILTVLLIAGLMITCDTAEGKWNMLELPTLPTVYDFGVIVADGVTKGETNDGNHLFTFTKAYDASKFNALVIEWASNPDWWSGGQLEDEAGKTLDRWNLYYDKANYIVYMYYDKDDLGDFNPKKVKSVAFGPLKFNPSKIYFTTIDDAVIEKLPYPAD